MNENFFRIEEKKYFTEFFHESSVVNLKEKVENLDYDSPMEGVNWFTSHYEKINSKEFFFTRKGNSKEEKDFEESFANPLCSVSRTNLLVVVEKKENKVSIKVFNSTTQRRVGKKFFKKTKRCDYVTFNTETKFLYEGHIIDYHKKRGCSKRVSKNYFAKNSVQSILVMIKNSLNYYGKNDGSNICGDISKVFLNLCGINQHFLYSIDDLLYLEYMKKMDIKYPNNFTAYRTLYSEYKPNLKEIRKHGGKFVDAFMEKNKISGKILKKVLHQVDKVDVPCYHLALKQFGSDSLNKDENLMKICLEGFETYGCGRENLKEIFTKKEFTNALELFKEIVFEKKITLTTFWDHVRDYTELKNFGETDLKWTCNKVNQKFFQEHLDWSEKVSQYKNGNYTRIYPERLKTTCCKPIVFNSVEYYPVLLETSTQFNDESNIQMNCVRTYIGKPSIFIFSLRKNSELSNERITIEYFLSKNEITSKISVKRVQDRGKYNSKPSEEWDEPISKLDSMVENFVKSKNYENVKIKKECKNGAILESDSIWENNRLVWEKTYLSNNHFSYIW